MVAHPIGDSHASEEISRYVEQQVVEIAGAKLRGDRIEADLVAYAARRLWTDGNWAVHIPTATRTPVRLGLHDWVQDGEPTHILFKVMLYGIPRA